MKKLLLDLNVELNSVSGGIATTTLYPIATAIISVPNTYNVLDFSIDY